MTKQEAVNELKRVVDLTNDDGKRILAGVVAMLEGPEVVESAHEKHKRQAEQKAQREGLA